MRVLQGKERKGRNAGALIIRIGFWVFLIIIAI